MRSGGWLTRSTIVEVGPDGCYGLQVDGENFSHVMIMEVAK